MKRTPLALLLLCLAAASAARRPRNRPEAASPPPADADARRRASSRASIPTSSRRRTPTSSGGYPKEQYIGSTTATSGIPTGHEPVEFFKEDDKYYYIAHPKALPRRAQLKEPSTTPGATTAPRASPDGPSGRHSVAVTLADFEDLLPAREAGSAPSSRRSRPRACRARACGALPSWLADMNGDGMLDIVAPPGAHRRRPSSTSGSGRRQGRPSRAWPLTFTEGGQADETVLDRLRRRGGRRHRRGRPHGRRLRVPRRRPRLRSSATGRAASRSCGPGLPGRDFSAQAIVAARRRRGRQARHRGLARHRRTSRRTRGVDKQQVRVYLVPGPGQGLGVQEGRPRRRLLLEQPARVGLRRRRPEGRADRQPLHGRADASLEERGRRHLLPGLVSRDRALRLPLRDGARDVRARRARRRSPTPSPCRPTCPRDAAGQRNQRSTRSRTANGRGTGSGARRTASPALRRSPWATSTGTASTTSSSRTARSGGSGSSSSSRTALSSRRPRPTSRPSTRPGQCVRLADLDGDGRLDIVVSKTVASRDPTNNGGWDVYLNRPGNLCALRRLPRFL